MHRVFVYGTLKRGYGNNERFLDGARYVRQEVSPPEFDLFNIGFPVALYSRGRGTHILGELFDNVSDKMLKRLDGLESAYDRITINFHDGPAFMYVGKHKYWDPADMEKCKTLRNGVTFWD